MLRMNWIHGSTTWRNGSYHAMRNATGMDTTKAMPKPVRTRETDAQTCSQSRPLSARSRKAARTFSGDAKTAGHVPDAASHRATASAREISAQAQLGTLLQMGTFFSFNDGLLRSIPSSPSFRTT